jgi:hypothetical protein
MQRLGKCHSRSRERPCTEDHDTVEAHYSGFKRTCVCLEGKVLRDLGLLTLTPRCVFLSAFRRIALMRVIFECVSENSLPIHHKSIADSSA